MARIFENDKGFLMGIKKKIMIICNVSNKDFKDSLKFDFSLFEKLFYIILRKDTCVRNYIGEYGIWNTNAFEEYEKYINIYDFHVIIPLVYLKPVYQCYNCNGINYHFIHDESSDLLFKIRTRAFGFGKYKKNRKLIKRILELIKPDLVYLIGAENPFYSSSVLDISKNIPVYVQLQTLMNDPDFKGNYPISEKEYNYRAKMELRVLHRANYIGSGVEKYNNILKQDFHIKSKILKTKLAVGERLVKQENSKKTYDFVYFSANINKAFDLALEAFIIANKYIKEINMLVIGSYDLDYKKNIDKKISEYGLGGNIHFTGRLETHQDVLKTIQTAKIALLPLKVDIMSGTIREAMACKLPVITTITKDGTIRLNENRKTVLLSEIGNHDALARNMVELLKNSSLAGELVENGIKLLKDEFDNENVVKMQIDSFESIFREFYEKKGFNENLLY